MLKKEPKIVFFHRDLDGVEHRLTLPHSSYSTTEFLANVADFMRAMGYYVPSEGIEFAYSIDEDSKED